MEGWYLPFVYTLITMIFFCLYVLVLRKCFGLTFRVESSKGTYAKEWVLWEKRLREVLFGNADYLTSIQVACLWMDACLLSDTKIMIIIRNILCSNNFVLMVNYLTVFFGDVNEVVNTMFCRFLSNLLLIKCWNNLKE